CLDDFGTEADQRIALTRIANEGADGMTAGDGLSGYCSALDAIGEVDKDALLHILPPFSRYFIILTDGQSTIGWCAASFPACGRTATPRVIPEGAQFEPRPLPS